MFSLFDHQNRLSLTILPTVSDLTSCNSPISKVRLVFNHGANLGRVLEWALTNSETEFAREAIEKRKSEIAEKGPEENGVKWAIEKNQLEVLSFLLNNAASLGGDEALKIAKECEERNGKECRVLVEDKTHLGDVVDVLDRALEKNHKNAIELIAKKQGFRGKCHIIQPVTGKYGLSSRSP